MDSKNAHLWNTLTTHRTLTEATLLPTGTPTTTPSITATFTQRHPQTSTKRTFTQSYIPPTYASSPPTESDTPTHPSCDTFIRFPTIEDNTYIEIWTIHGLQASKKLPHGKLYTDEWFGRVAMSHCKEYVAYIAEAKCHSGDSEEWRDRSVEKFDITASDPLGEAYAQTRPPALFIHHLPSGTTISPLTADLYPGQPVWYGQKLVITLRPSTPQSMIDTFGEGVHDLGVKYCYNRPSQVGIIDIDMEYPPEKVRILSKGENCVFSPTVSGDRLLYLATMPGGSIPLPHNPGKVLRYVDLEKGTPPVTLIKGKYDPALREFPGLYAHQLPEHPLLDDSTIVFTSVWDSTNRLLAATVSLEPGKEGTFKIVDLLAEVPSKLLGADLGWIVTASITLYDVRDGNLLIGASDPITPTQLLLLHVVKGKITSVVSVTKKSQAVQHLASYLQESRTIDLVAVNPDSRESLCEAAVEFESGDYEPWERFQVMVLRPAKNDKDKDHLIVYPHGGPHTTTLNTYSQSTMALLQKGYTVLYINYRGSLGLGERSLDTLPGNIGTQDVNEVVQATRWALKTYQLSGTSFVGGSHSGFLGAHTSLIPGLFRGTVLRNPVVDLPSMQGGTDIPDWCFCEAGVPTTPGFIADAEVLKKMFQVSPVAFVNECHQIGRTLLQLGKGDRRVPVGQGLLWRRVLNGRFGDVCDIRFYPSSGHAVDEVPEGDDAWVAALDFLDATVTSPPTECLHISHRKV